MAKEYLGFQKVSGPILYIENIADIGFGESLVVTVVVYVLSVVSLLPNNLGILEILYGYTGHLSGLETDEAIAVALLFRAAHITACSIVAAISIRAGPFRRF